jgi:hypothetical protein
MSNRYNSHEITVTSIEVQPKYWNLHVGVFWSDDGINFRNRPFTFLRQFPTFVDAENYGQQFAKNWIDNGKPNISSTPP